MCRGLPLTISDDVQCHNFSAGLQVLPCSVSSISVSADGSTFDTDSSLTSAAWFGLLLRARTHAASLTAVAFSCRTRLTLGRSTITGYRRRRHFRPLVQVVVAVTGFNVHGGSGSLWPAGGRGRATHETARALGGLAMGHIRGH